jgi:hypothetical protein
LADYPIADDEVGAWEKTMAAGGDTVTFARDCDEVRVTNVDGAAAIYYTVNGDPVVAGANDTYWVPATAGASRTTRVPHQATVVVTLDSSGTPVFSVEGSFS